MKNVSICFATATKQTVVDVCIDDDNSMLDAIRKSGIKSLHSEINLDDLNIGVYSVRKDLKDIPRDGDRIEIYRPLVIDPKESRRQKAGAQQNQKNQ